MSQLVDMLESPAPGAASEPQAARSSDEPQSPWPMLFHSFSMKNIEIFSKKVFKKS